MRNLMPPRFQRAVALLSIALELSTCLMAYPAAHAESYSLSPTCRSEVATQHYLRPRSDVNGSYPGAREWAMDRLRADALREENAGQRGSCTEKVLQQAVHDQQEYWNSLAGRFQCGAAAHRNLPQCLKYSENAEYLKAADSVLSLDIPAASPASYTESAPPTQRAHFGPPVTQADTSNCNTLLDGNPLSPQYRSVLNQMTNGPLGSLMTDPATGAGQAPTSPPQEEACAQVNPKDRASPEEQAEKWYNLHPVEFVTNCVKGAGGQLLQDIWGAIKLAYAMFFGVPAVCRSLLGWFEEALHGKFSQFGDDAKNEVNKLLGLVFNGVAEYIYQDVPNFSCYKRAERDEKACRMGEKALTIALLALGGGVSLTAKLSEIVMKGLKAGAVGSGKLGIKVAVKTGNLADKVGRATVGERAADAIESGTKTAVVATGTAIKNAAHYVGQTRVGKVTKAAGRGAYIAGRAVVGAGLWTIALPFRGVGWAATKAWHRITGTAHGIRNLFRSSESSEKLLAAQAAADAAKAGVAPVVAGAPAAPVAADVPAAGAATTAAADGAATAAKVTSELEKEAESQAQFAKQQAQNAHKTPKEVRDIYEQTKAEAMRSAADRERRALTSAADRERQAQSQADYALQKAREAIPKKKKAEILAAYDQAYKKAMEEPHVPAVKPLDVPELSIQDQKLFESEATQYQELASEHLHNLHPDWTPEQVSDGARQAHDLYLGHHKQIIDDAIARGNQAYHWTLNHEAVEHGTQAVSDAAAKLARLKAYEEYRDFKLGRTNPEELLETESGTTVSGRTPAELATEPAAVLSDAERFARNQADLARNIALDAGNPAEDAEKLAQMTYERYAHPTGQVLSAASGDLTKLVEQHKQVMVKEADQAARAEYQRVYDKKLGKRNPKLANDQANAEAGKLKADIISESEKLMDQAATLGHKAYNEAIAQRAGEEEAGRAGILAYEQSLAQARPPVGAATPAQLRQWIDDLHRNALADDPAGREVKVGPLGNVIKPSTKLMQNWNIIHKVMMYTLGFLVTGSPFVVIDQRAKAQDNEAALDAERCILKLATCITTATPPAGSQ